MPNQPKSDVAMSEMEGEDYWTRIGRRELRNFGGEDEDEEGKRATAKVFTLDTTEETYISRIYRVLPRNCPKVLAYCSVQVAFLELRQVVKLRLYTNILIFGF